MANALVEWDLPTARTSGAVVLPSDIENVAVAFSANQGVDFTDIRTVTPENPQQHLFTELEPGTWVVRLTVHPKVGRGISVDTPFTIIDDSDVLPVQNVRVTI